MPIRSKPKALKNARLRQCGLSENEFYQFSLSHTLSIYPLNATYTFIPKNACSTLRYSIAVANGFLRHDDDVNWIHANNGSFVASQKESACADYSFVVLRCPFRRLVSCFLDKFVRGNLDFRDETGAVLDFSFSDFLTFIESQERSAMDHHWRNQTDFLHYQISCTMRSMTTTSVWSVSTRPCRHFQNRG